MADASLKAKLPRKSAFSCEVCRKRKVGFPPVKCNGASPACSRCAVRGELCVYSLAPTLSYTKQLEARVAQLENALSHVHARQPSETDSGEGPSPAKRTRSPGSQTPLRDRRQSSEELARDLDGLQVEHDGRISFHGPTSLFQLPGGVFSETSSASQLITPIEGRKERLVNNAWRQRAYEQMAAMPEPYQYLLDSHWCWIHPLFNFVYRPAFTRDLKINGPYYSDALLNALLSHSVRWCKTEPEIGPILDSFDGGAQFSHRAVTELYDSLKVGHVGIPTIQTLLLLSAQECGRGNRTQAWLYSGMAFRMLDDLGVSIDSLKYSDSAKLNDEDIEIRNRLFWSCYFWDKMVSLYFGRSPTMQNSRVSPPQTILDNTAEIENWTPHGVVFPDGFHYPPTQAHSTSAFVKMCGLAEILNEILIHIYDPIRQVSEMEFYSCVEEQAQNLAEWWEELPDFLKLIVSDLPPYSPPAHIVILNCLYHTINILLHRPILCSKSRQSYDKSHLVQCMISATAILSLFDLFSNTFGDGHVVLSLAYSVYTAASIFLLEIQALKYVAPGTLEKLKFCIYALERVKISNPVMATALGLIYRELQKLRVDINITLPPTQSTQPFQPQSHSHQTNTPSPQHNNNHSHRPHTPPRPRLHNPPLGVPPAASLLPEYTPFHPPPPPAPTPTPAAAANFDPSHARNPHMATTHLIGGIPSAVMALESPGSYEITPEVFEAFSYAEPITTNMTQFEESMM
ncbi:putative Zn(II)2Cys6 transcription factor [Aspergillus campestris IBT 28561]|uniref:Zn(II)2Cys6 transcription factor n=1 Tax=Aspergillus campestris (strain IBT 28561) TaxID=1392248 RepID=A0A2I1DH45_ASPC2|nr:putative Zn(II)2Cys6 transcription factor [Aspergillus campestris IBT 28561]PKY09197.1 putative Zn(II)2Cys6 transcription factor [Aspergillus campestris IBT 28561]